MQNMLLLEISNLVKNYGSLKAVDQVSFSVQKGEVLGLLGPNGAGKTTIINAITTLETPDSGSIKVGGLDVQKSGRICKSLLGFMPQEVINHGYFTVEEVLFHHAGYYGYLNREYQKSLLKKVALFEHRQKKILTLSGGMKRRLLLAKALVHNPRVVLLDEPTTGVDVGLREDIWNLVRDLKDQGKAVLFTTHYLEEAEQLCDRVAIINKGRLVTENKTLSLIKEHTFRKCTVTLKKDRDIPLSSIKKLRPHVFEFSIHPSKGLGEFLEESPIALSNIKDIQIQEGTLEDVFKAVLKEDVQ